MPALVTCCLPACLPEKYDMPTDMAGAPECSYLWMRQLDETSGRGDESGKEQFSLLATMIVQKMKPAGATANLHSVD